MRRKLIDVYTDVAGAFLLAAALMLLLGSLGNITLAQPRDPIFLISVRYLFCGAGLAALLMAFICLFAKATWPKLAILLWVGVNLIVLQLGSFFQTRHFSLAGYSGILENAFHLSGNATDWSLKFLSVCLTVASLSSLLWLWVTAKNTVKIICAHCGGHVQFPITAIGTRIPCPHCQEVITLQQAEILKMSCFFCKGHIEFPAHAMGHKLKCPHCKMDIALNEPASV